MQYQVLGKRKEIRELKRDTGFIKRAGNTGL